MCGYSFVLYFHSFWQHYIRAIYESCLSTILRNNRELIAILLQHCMRVITLYVCVYSYRKEKKHALPFALLVILDSQSMHR